MSDDRLFFDFGEADLINSPVWYFPRDETVKDELTLRPVADAGVLDTDHEVVVRTMFRCHDGAFHLGFLHWGDPSTIGYVRPVMFVGSFGVRFWHGIRRPSAEYLKKVSEVLSPSSFPVSYESEAVFGLRSLRGSLDGICFLSNGRTAVAWP